MTITEEFEKLVERAKIITDLNELNTVSYDNMYKFYTKVQGNSMFNLDFKDIYDYYFVYGKIYSECNIEMLYSDILIHYNINFLYDNSNNLIKIL